MVSVFTIVGGRISSKASALLVEGEGAERPDQRATPSPGTAGTSIPTGGRRAPGRGCPARRRYPSARHAGARRRGVASPATHGLDVVLGAAAIGRVRRRQVRQQERALANLALRRVGDALGPRPSSPRARLCSATWPALASSPRTAGLGPPARDRSFTAARSSSRRPTAWRAPPGPASAAVQLGRIDAAAGRPRHRARPGSCATSRMSIMARQR